MKTNTELWFEVNSSTPIEILDKVCQLDYSVLFVNGKAEAKLLDKFQVPQRMKLAYFVSSIGEVEKLEKDETVNKIISYFIVDNLELFDKLKGKKAIKTGLLFNVKNRADLDQAVELVKEKELVILEFKDPTNIPLELILATTQNTACRIFKRVHSAKDGEVSLLTMEIGCDGILLSSNEIQEVSKLGTVLQRSKAVKFDLKEAVVTQLKNTGMGTRVCIDTTSELFPDEGILLGSTSSGGILTCSETHFLPYMNLRNFRVNAGGLHLYAWGPNDRAVYLSDLRAGDSIYVVNSKGEARLVTIGRLKNETRPLLYIQCSIEGTSVSTFIQDDWHVRMFGSKGEIRPSSEIRVGDKLLGFLDKPGRHVGIKIDETIVEV